MKKYLKNTPFSITSIMLGTASLGHLFADYRFFLYITFSIIALVLWLVFVLKFIIYFKIVKKELQEPGVFAIAPTFTMGSMMLLINIEPFIPKLSLFSWIILIILQLLIMAIFTYYFIIKNFTLQNFIPGWFVMYAGTGIIAVTAVYFNSLLVGQIFFGFSLVINIYLFPLLAYRTIKYKLPQNTYPTIAIFAAPLSLTLLGYLNSYSNYNLILVMGLQFFAIIMTMFVIFKLFAILKNGFYPSFAALTFPFVISASCVVEVYEKYEIVFLHSIMILEIIFSTIMILFVIGLFIRFVVQESKD